MFYQLFVETELKLQEAIRAVKKNIPKWLNSKKNFTNFRNTMFLAFNC